MKVFFLCLCIGIAQPTYAQETDDDDESSDTEIELKEPVILKKDTNIIVNNSYKKLYNIAYILPINTEKINVGDGKTIQTTMPMRTREVLGFWEGATVAFDSVKRMKSKFNLHIWDNKYNDSITDEILSFLQFHNIDVVVSPFHTRQAVAVSKYCKENNIAFFLAQNPSDAPVKSNDLGFKFHISKNRTFYTYYKRLTGDISENNSSIFFIYNDNSKSDRRLKNYLLYMDKLENTNRLQPIAYTDNIDYSSLLDSNNNNAIIVSLYKSDEVNKVLEGVSALPNYAISIYGHNLWVGNGKLKKDLLSKLNSRVFTDYFIGNRPDAVEKIKNKYTALTKDNIVSDVFLGYDVTIYIAQVLDRFGMDFPQYVDSYKYYGATTNVHMLPKYNSSGGLLFYENNAKFLLRATESGWIKEGY